MNPLRATTALALTALTLATSAAACGGSTTTAPPAQAQTTAYAQQGQQPYPQQPYPQQPYPQQPYPQQPYPQQPYPQQPYPQQPYPQQPYPQQTVPAPPTMPTQPTRPLLAPLVGSLAWRTEVAAVMTELIANLSPVFQAKVKGIPLQFENNPAEINAYAGCDDKGASFMAGTEGILLAFDAISQTKATDELYGTHTYEQYASTVAPQLVRSETATPTLPMGIIPNQLLLDPRRLSRAHELFDELAAFTFGHELSHHYLGHTGCANGDNFGALSTLGHLVTGIVPVFNQPNESAADNFGVFNVLDTGRARRPQYQWTEGGGLVLLDFFGRLNTAAGADRRFLEKYTTSHPDPAIRIGWVQTFARLWRAQHPN